MSADILIVDDETDIRELIDGILEDEGYTTRQAATSAEAFARIEERVPSLIILDIWLQGSEHDGMEILQQVKKEHPFLPVLMISGHGNIETAVAAIKRGAYDFIEKPFKSDRLLLMIGRALENAALRRENETLKARAEGPSDMVGSSPAISSLRQTLSRIAQTNSRVLITGEPGTGKDIAARQIHKMSARSNGPFMTVNCAIMRPDHIEMELFGTEPMAGVPAIAGVLEQADGGTLLLDEVADMPPETQAKIVRVLQEQRFTRLGGQEPVEVDVRVLATTNRDLHSLMEEGAFRQDLYYRLNVVPLDMPPLRDRPQDIPLLADYFMGQFAAQAGLATCEISSAAIGAMQSYHWPGNVRQLRNVMEWLLIMAGSDGTIRPDHLPPEICNRSTGSESEEDFLRREIIGLPLREAREFFEKDYLLAQVRRFGGNVSKTAEFIGMERSALHRKMKQLGISTVSKQNDDSADGDVSEADDRKTA